MKKIGLTGGIGVGKTFVAELFQQLGVPVFNADIEAKKCMVEDEKLVSAVQLAFGESIYMNAVLQKEELAKIVFNNEVDLAKLNALVHPVVKQKFEDWCENQSSELVIKEAAILFESDAHIGLDAVICVSAIQELRIVRVQKRDGSSVEEVKSRINKQMPQAEKEELADFIIVNDGEKLLLPQVLKVLKEME
ncbi:dephospho-CoA kinase [Flavobacteriales bacterium]|jgi:dephospho-CoA kinase|nr:dephospho-CoA kinase [Flavobacteriales bacterium]MBT4882164.1 dephospho-CoA kinase [Flavobacteriales bacterium]MDC3305766.1 dephospho-CoA kinase [Flavobacteriales bacterium]MDG1349052.1 dephospho-CoA kinase [Flavobacteriales bacterium]|tara:strand:+ start:603 stop:1178 length:576 start_codon:yes stop_codon:yes gene_type:complete